MSRWGMLLDLKLCVGCYACTIGCAMEHRTPPGVFFAPVYEQEEGTFPNVRRSYLPTLCMHCDDALCITACPSAAIRKRDDGIVLVDQDLCCGSRACIAACPYGAMNFFHEEAKRPGLLGQVLTANHQVGTALKCTFCAHRIDAGITTPACVQTCPTQCRIFGDLDDPTSAVSLRRRESGAAPARPEAGTNPRVYYAR